MGDSERVVRDIFTTFSSLFSKQIWNEDLFDGHVIVLPGGNTNHWSAGVIYHFPMK